MFLRLRSLDAGMVLASLVALTLIGPLRDILQEIPVFAFAGTIFCCSSCRASYWRAGSMKEYFSAVSLVPAGFRA